MCISVSQSIERKKAIYKRTGKRFAKRDILNAIWNGTPLNSFVSAVVSFVIASCPNMKFHEQRRNVSTFIISENLFLVFVVGAANFRSMFANQAFHIIIT